MKGEDLENVKIKWTRWTNEGEYLARSRANGCVTSV